MNNLKAIKRENKNAGSNNKLRAQGFIPAVLYGGSVDGNSVKIFKDIKEIDGFLIGGASKSSKKFIDIIKNYYR